MPKAAALRPLLMCLLALVGAGASARAPAIARGATVGDASGVPPMTRFNAEHYSVIPQHNAITTDASGRVFVGNVEGLLVYSAGRFEHVRGTGDMSIRSLAILADGQVLAGGYDQFGSFTEQPDGRWQYTDLDERFRASEGAHPIGQVWMVTALAGDLYIQAERRLFRIGADGATASWATPGRALMGLRVGDEIWARIADRGLMRFTGDGFELVPGGEAFAAAGVQATAPHPRGTLFTSRLRGLFIGDARDGLRHVDTDYDDWLRSTQPYAVTALKDGGFAIATLSGELAIVDTALKLRKRFRISNYPITAVAQNVDGGLWCTTDGDLVRVEWPSPWTFVGEEDGLSGALNDAEWSGGRRWVATTQGLFRSEADAGGRVRFQPLPWARDEVWDLLRVGDDLLVGERRSVQLIHADQPRTLLDSNAGVFELIPSRFATGRVLALEDSAVVELESQPDWHAGPRHDLGDVSVSTLVELDAAHWLIGNWRGTPLLAERAADGKLMLKALAADAGITAPGDSGSSVWRLGEQVFATLGDTLYAWRDDRFVPAPEHPLVAKLGARLNEIETRGSGAHQYAFTSRNVWIGRDGDWQPLRIESRRALGLSELSLSDDGRLTVVGWGGLLTYDPRQSAATEATFHLRMHRVTLTERKGGTRLLDRRGDRSLTLPPLEGLRFEYGIDGHDSAVEYRSRLDTGDTAEWSDWSSAPQREFNRLTPGDYTFRVEARTRGGRGAGSALDFPFHVEPRWYQTQTAAWLITGGVLALASLLAWLWGRHRSQRLRERNVALEREVAAHTRELEVANQRLSRLAVQDGLTGLTNRRGFEQFYARSWNRLAEQREPLSVLMFDVDFFKQYNDQHGHLLGDEVLRGIARELEAEVREPVELLARFGGEEFVMVLPGVDIERATERANAARQRCEAYGREREITVSVGVASCVPRGGLKSSQLLDEADAALYRAKKQGRNRTERGRLL